MCVAFLLYILHTSFVCFVCPPPPPPHTHTTPLQKKSGRGRLAALAVSHGIYAIGGESAGKVLIGSLHALPRIVLVATDLYQPFLCETLSQKAQSPDGITLTPLHRSHSASCLPRECLLTPSPSLTFRVSNPRHGVIELENLISQCRTSLHIFMFSAFQRTLARSLFSQSPSDCFTFFFHTSDS